jgi:hypothetical protein
MAGEMNFELIRDSLKQLLVDAAAGRFRVIGHQLQGQDAGAMEGSDRSVQVYFFRSEFPKGKGSTTGPVMNEITFNLELSVSAAAEGDLAPILDPGSTALELKAAIESFKEATELANTSLDELARIVYQIVMDARNIDLGHASVVADRWVLNIQKDEPIPRGELVVLTGIMSLTCAIDEQLAGDEGVPMTEGVDTEFEVWDQAGLNEDTVQKTGTLNK